MITREQLDHLCMLTALELTDTEKDAMLPQLSSILDFIGQLNSFEIQETNTGREEYALPSTTALEATEGFGPALTQNIHHEIRNGMPILKTGLAK